MPQKKSRDTGSTIMSIELTQKARHDLDMACADMGMTKKAFTERLINWIVVQSQVVQRMVLNPAKEQATKVSDLEGFRLLMSQLERQAGESAPSEGFRDSP